MSVRCGITRDGYLDDFIDFWSRNEHTRQIWMSLYTPQVGEGAHEILTRDDRHRVADIEAALCNCLGFGSKNSAIVLGH